MRLRFLAGGALALLLVSGEGVLAAEQGHKGFLSNFALPGLWGGKSREPAAAQPEAPPVVMAQAVDPRVTQLEEEIRKLSGTVEDLNFQILQMQEQMRKQQEDNEFRFQELEGGSGKPATGASGNTKPPKSKSELTAPSGNANATADTGAAAPADTAASSLPAGTAQTASASGAAAPAASGTGAPAQPLGTITFDASGNVTGGSVGDQAVISRGPTEQDADGTTVASLPQTGDPEELYRSSYEYILSGNYKTAEAGFRDHIARFPTDARAADAHFWLGEALLGQERYSDAAEVFLAANKAYPKSRKAPDMLLKLGVALTGMNQRDVACATFGEVEKRYPDMSSALKGRLRQEKALASC